MLDIDSIKTKVTNQAKKLTDSYFPNLGTKKDVPQIGGSAVPKLGGSTAAQGEIVDGFHWAGIKKSEIQAHYNSLHALGVQHKEYYLVRFRAYKNNALRGIPIIENPLSGWLATEVSVPILQVDTDTRKVGSYSMNHVTGRQAPEITITMIETNDNMVMESLRQMKNIMCRSDGTFGLPSEYSLWLEVFLYGRDKGIAYPKSASRFLCFASQVNMDASSSDSGALLLPITFTQSRPFMPL